MSRIFARRVLLLLAVSWTWHWSAAPDSTEVEQSVEYLIDLFCSQTGDEAEKLKSNAIEGLGSLRVISDVLPENAGVDSLRKIRDGLERCGKNLAGERQKESSRQMLDITKKLEGELANMKALQENLDRVHSQISGILRLPRSIKEWPPESLCSPCPEDWETIEKMIKAVEDANFFIGRKEPADLAAAVDFGAFIERLCSSIEAFNAIRWEWIEDELRYFSWTETWKSMDSIRYLVAPDKITTICTSQ